MAERVVGSGSFGVVFQVRTRIYEGVGYLVDVFLLEILIHCVMIIFFCRRSVWKQEKQWQ